jgi:hypothetical protein
MKPHFLNIQTHLPEKSIRLVCIAGLLFLSCSLQPVPDSKALGVKWIGKHINILIEKMGAPHHVTLLPDGEKQYIYRFSPKPVYDDIFRGEFLNDMSTIRIQEDLAREEQSKCLLEVFVKNNLIVSIDASGNGCWDIREKLGEE